MRTGATRLADLAKEAGNPISHDDAAARLSVESRRRALGFIEAVQRFPENVSAAEELGRENEFDPQGPFLVAVHAGDHRPAVLEMPFIVVEDSRCTTVVTQPHLVGEKAEADLADCRFVFPLTIHHSQPTIHDSRSLLRRAAALCCRRRTADAKHPPYELVR